MKSNKEVIIEANAKDTIAFVDRTILINDGKLTLGFSASADTVVGVKFWSIKIEGKFYVVFS